MRVGGFADVRGFAPRRSAGVATPLRSEPSRVSSRGRATPRTLGGAVSKIVLAAFMIVATTLAGVSPAAAEPPGPEASLAVGDDHSCFLVDEGKISCVGDGDSGQLGDGTNFEDRRKPHEVVGIETAVAVSAGEDHTCAVIIDGRVKCWGDNDNGQLGNGGGPDRSAPVFVTGITDAVAVAAGDNHTCAVRENGTVLCWGDNSDGQLGNGTTTDSALPVFVKNIGRAQAVAAGQFHTCIVTSTDHVSCWGDNSTLQLGDATNVDRLNAKRVNGVEGVTSVAAGFGHTCASQSDGLVMCWGRNRDGQLGNGTLIATGTPKPVSGIQNARQVSVGYRTTCAVDGGIPKCWGNNEFGQLGNGNKISSAVPVTVSWPAASPVSAIGVGDDHNCLISDDLQIGCWGDNADGQLGRGDNLPEITPFTVDAEAFISVAFVPPSSTLDELWNRPDFKKAHADVLRLYQAFFRRQPDLPGAIFWIGEYEKGQTVRFIAERFTGTPEFNSFYAGTSNEVFTTRVYRNVLLRGPDGAGFDFWVNQLDTGMSRGEMVTLIANAPEFIDNNRFGGL